MASPGPLGLPLVVCVLVGCTVLGPAGVPGSPGARSAVPASGSVPTQGTPAPSMAFASPSLPPSPPRSPEPAATPSAAPSLTPSDAPSPAPAATPSPAATPTPAATPSPRPTSTPAPVSPELGLTWKAATMPSVSGRPTGKIEAVTAGGPGFVAVGRGCTFKGEGGRCEAIVWTSRQGNRWTLAPRQDSTSTGFVIPMSGPELGMFDVAAGKAGIVAIGYAARPAMSAVAWFSKDGATWRRVRIGSAAKVRVKAVTWSGGRFVIVGEDRSEFTGRNLSTATARAAVWTSTDGRQWNRVPHEAMFNVGRFVDTMEDPSTGGMRDVTAGPNGFVAVGTRCTGEPIRCRPAAWRSGDGRHWTRVSGMPEVDGSLNGVASSPAGYVAVGGGLVVTSPDGLTWTQRATVRTADLRMIARVGVRYVATSPDGPASIWMSRRGRAWAVPTFDGGPDTFHADGAGDWHFASTATRAVWLGSYWETGDRAAWVSRAP